MDWRALLGGTDELRRSVACVTAQATGELIAGAEKAVVVTEVTKSTKEVQVSKRKRRKIEGQSAAVAPESPSLETAWIQVIATDPWIDPTIMAQAKTLVRDLRLTVSPELLAQSLQRMFPPRSEF